MFRPCLRQLSSKAAPKFALHKPSELAQNYNITKLTYFNNPYKAHVPWPPDFSKLNPQQQFRLEKRYRRRAKNKYVRPRWNQGVKIAAWGGSIFIAVYALLFMEWPEREGPEIVPFEEIRDWFFPLVRSFWTTDAAKIKVEKKPFDPRAHWPPQRRAEDVEPSVTPRQSRDPAR